MARATPDDLALLNGILELYGSGADMTGPGGTIGEYMTRLSRTVQRMEEEDGAWAGRRLHFEVDTDHRLVIVARDSLAQEPPLGIPFAYFKRATGMILAHEAEQDRIVCEAEGKPYTASNAVKMGVAKNLLAEADAEVSASRASAALRRDPPSPPPSTERRQIPGVDY